MLVVEAVVLEPTVGIQLFDRSLELLHLDLGDLLASGGVVLWVVDDRLVVVLLVLQCLSLSR